MKDKRKIAFIICVNDEMELQECHYYLSRLAVPEGIETEVLSIWDAQSMTSGYREGMESTDAKYKVYLHQDTFIINPNFISDMLAVFQENPQIGMLGCVGASKWMIEEEYLPVNCYDTGKVFHNLNESYLDYANPQGGHLKVVMVDGLLMATQVDIPWREDLFRGWQFYDAAQSMEMQRNGKEVVVPFQKMPWCYHDNGANNMASYYGDYELFLKEYFPKMEGFKPPKGEGTLELKAKFKQLKEMMDRLLEAGEREAFLNICQNPAIEVFLDFQEYFVIAYVEKAEAQNLEVHRLWEEGLSKDELITKMRTLKHLLKRLEYDAEEGTECAYLQKHYSDSAITVLIQKYVWDKGKVESKLHTCFH